MALRNSLTAGLAIAMILVAGSWVQSDPGSDTVVLADFEDNEFQKQWTCNSAVEQSPEHASSGRFSLRVSVDRVAKWPDLWFEPPRRDWTGFRELRMDVFYPHEKPAELVLHFTDSRSVDWNHKASMRQALETGENPLRVTLPLKTHGGHRLLDLKDMGTITFAVRDELRGKTLYLDNLRLVTERFVAQEKKEIRERLAARRLESEEAYHRLKKTLAKARSEGIDTAYEDATAVVAEIGLKIRLDLPWFQTEKRQAEIFDYVLQTCEKATGDLREVMGGRRAERHVPSHPRLSWLEPRGPYYYLGTEPRLLVAANGSSLPFLSPGVGYENSFSVHGGWDGWLKSNDPVMPLNEALKNHPDTKGPDGNICLESPHTWEAVRKWLTEIYPRRTRWIGNPSVLLNSLGYELGYTCRCDRSETWFREWLLQRYGAISGINEAWQTTYTSLDQITIPDLEEAGANRARWYDWCRFNQDRLIHHLKRRREVLKSLDPETPIGAGGYECIDALGALSGVRGVDTEGLINELCDVVNNESHNTPIYTDLLRSLSEFKKPIIDPEYHGDIPGIFLQFLHGDAALQYWWWPRECPPDHVERAVSHSPKIPLSEVAEFLRTALDVRRLGQYIVPFPGARREIAILYSKTTLLQTPPELIHAERFRAAYTPYLVELRRAYVATQFLDIPREFITELQIERERLNQYRILIVPGVSHLRAGVWDRIVGWVRNGGVLIVSPNTPLYNEYHRPAAYLKEIGIEVQRTVEPPLRQYVSGCPQSNEAYLHTYFRESGLLDREPERMSPSPKDIFQNQRGDLRCLGVRQSLVEKPGAVVLARFPDGSPGIVLIERGRGRIYYLAGALLPRDFAGLIDRIVEKEGLRRPIRVVDTDGESVWGVEARTVPGEKDGEYLLYLANVQSKGKRVFLKTDLPIGGMTELRAMEDCPSREIALGPRETKLFLITVRHGSGDAP